MNDTLNNILNIILNKKVYLPVIIIIIGIIVYKIIEKSINKFMERDKKTKRLDKKGKTMVKLFTNIIKYIIIAIAVAMILQVYGININSLIAGLGLVSIIAGLAIQDPLKDIATGINIITDDYYSLGDIISIDEIEGKVIQLGIRTTKIKDIKTGNIYVIANRNISKIKKVSDELYLDVPIPYEESIPRIEKVLRNACNNIEKIDNVHKAENIGLNEFASSSLIFKIKILCNPEFNLSIKRKANKIIKLELDKEKISIPYPHITIKN